uniref:Uncharacterized protein n=1 Tax=Plectus sambesii TaxID=2011161 RepID=A0A914WU48_9BILA
MAASKRPRPTSSDDVYKTEVQQQPSLIFDENIDYEFSFEENMRFLESDFNRPWDNAADQAWNFAWNSLLFIKAKWLFYQNRASLAIPIPAPPHANGQMWNGDAFKLREKFQRMYAYLERFPKADEARTLLIKESLIAEWPRQYTPFSDSGEAKPLIVDRAPILRMSMKTVNARVRRWHPTVQLSVLALNKETAKVSHARFTARLVTQNSTQVQLNESWCSVGRLICTEREGEVAMPKDIICNGNALVIAGGINERGALRFDNTGTLCAQFTDLGVDTGDKKKATSRQRYCIEIVSEIRLANGLELRHSTLSHPFLIVPNTEQNKTILGDIIWDILSAEPGNTNMPAQTRIVAWHKLKVMVQHYVQSQLIEARTLDSDELLHIQTMLFLPLALHCNDLLELELQLFGGFRGDVEKQGIKKIKYRLLREFVRDDYPVNHDSFFTQKCIELKDCKTPLPHSVWEWLFEAVEVIIDRNSASLLCEDVSQQKTKKDKKSSMMLKLFNDKIITMSSREREWKVYKMLSKYDDTHQPDQQTRAMLIRFCESEAGSLSFGYSNIEGSVLKPSHGSMPAKKIKEIKNGLIGMIMEAPWPSKFDRLVRFKSDNGEGKSGASFPTKQQIFKYYDPKANISPVAETAIFDPFIIHPLHGPTDFPALKSPPYLDYSSYPESPYQAPTPQPPQTHSMSYSVDLFGKGEDVLHAVELNGMRDHFKTMTVSTANSEGLELSSSKKNSRSSNFNSGIVKYERPGL